MKKYQENLSVDYTRNIPYYRTTLPETVPPESVPFYYAVRIGERLDNISQRFYKTPNKWWVIAKANNLTDGSVAVSAGTKLLIPNV